MMFLGEYDAQLMWLSFRPSLAHYNYLYAVVLVRPGSSVLRPAPT